MKIEYFADGSEDCPLILLYEGSENDVAVLTQAINQLINGNTGKIAVHELADFNSIGSCELFLSLGIKDKGVRQISNSCFDCLLTAVWWQNVAGLLEPFINISLGYATHFQWLDETSNIALVISTSRDW